ncbi:nucleotidyltransferase family protein [Mobilitalea sibirica]|uniref:Nucleotidyltransferase family protein n=1 Tax=Mobilitalea sibirica TaxID=1462919 RepID=A0A8J7KRK0_9FIRM|nr:nucleotidyltransferase family protein [Mobilitalea sibirica]MBH1939381.1 nucleotidyltransferase family protein [Mobilitalea sibirica]
MNYHSQILITLLSNAIRGQEPSIEINKTIDWYEVYEEALAHQVHTLIYPCVTRLSPKSKPDPELLSKWEKETMRSVSEQLQHIDIIGHVLDTLYQEGIQVVALKGLILREYYPEPELRTMGDADILVHREDTNKVGKILNSFGYEEGISSNKHIAYIHQYYPCIEVHWTLSNQENNKSPVFTGPIWQNTKKSDLLGNTTYILSDEDQLLHLIVHSLNHIYTSGFGLRQLCDITLFIEAKINTINWRKVKAEVILFSMYNFASSIFILCKRLFFMKIPNDFIDATINTSYIDMLLQDIIHSGVYGKRTPEREACSSILRFLHTQGSTRPFTGFHYKLSFLFPSSKCLGPKYNYAKKNPLLLPIAWLHRGIKNIRRKEFITQSSKINAIGKERAKLLHWLQLR